ncbi:hypothetical protein LIER_33499 [Lithospermum erythrorhizon]|uniref:DUF569 domain-containing protein n=1 Tax=Lithospermum erythrorhizon TaxID=34254 RepID=A0AAV3S244_LITER
MELLKKAKLVKLKSQHNKYLIADDEEEKVRQEREGSSKHARWTVEFLDDFENSIRLKSCFGKYLTATDEQFVLGVTGRHTDWILCEVEVVAVRQEPPKKMLVDLFAPSTCLSVSSSLWR